MEPERSAPALEKDKASGIDISDVVEVLKKGPIRMLWKTSSNMFFK